MQRNNPPPSQALNEILSPVKANCLPAQRSFLFPNLSKRAVEQLPGYKKKHGRGLERELDHGSVLEDRYPMPLLRHGRKLHRLPKDYPGCLANGQNIDFYDARLNEFTSLVNVLRRVRWD